MRLIVLLIILIVFELQSCKMGTHEFSGNDKIDSDIKRQIHALNEQLVESVLTNNSALLKEMLSPNLIKNSSADIDKLIEQARTIIKDREYETVDEYYMKSSKTGIDYTVVSGTSDDHDYKIVYRALNDESFISLIVPKADIDNIIIAIFYGKFEDGWKLNIFQSGQFTINEKTATEHFKQAQLEYDKGYLVDAISSMYLASKCLKPFSFWEYHQSKEINAFQKKLAKEVGEKYSFPIAITQVETAPEVYNIMPFGMNEGYFPMVKYISKIDIKDTVALRKENEQIQKVIGQEFPGIDKDKALVFYKAVNELPNGKTPVPSYGFIQEIK